MINYNKLHDRLTDAIIDYYYRLEQPMPSPTETRAVRILRYRSDPLFHNKVASMVAGIVHIVRDAENEQTSFEEFKQATLKVLQEIPNESGLGKGSDMVRIMALHDAEAAVKNMKEEEVDRHG